MVNEAEKYAEEDEVAKGKIGAKNSFESYIFNVKNTLEDEKLKVGVWLINKPTNQPIRPHINPTICQSINQS